MNHGVRGKSFNSSSTYIHKLCGFPSGAKDDNRKTNVPRFLNTGKCSWKLHREPAFNIRNYRAMKQSEMTDIPSISGRLGSPWTAGTRVVTPHAAQIISNPITRISPHSCSTIMSKRCTKSGDACATTWCLFSYSFVSAVLSLWPRNRKTNIEVTDPQIYFLHSKPSQMEKKITKVSYLWKISFPDPTLTINSKGNIWISRWGGDREAGESGTIAS